MVINELTQQSIRKSLCRGVLGSSICRKALLRQKLKTHRVENSLNPELNEGLTLCIEDPCMPMKLEVNDYDTLTFDDNMGEAEIDIRPLIEVVNMGENYLVEESCVVFKDKKVVQDMCLRLKNVESGEIEIQLQWIDLPGSKGVLFDVFSRSILLKLAAHYAAKRRYYGVLGAYIDATRS
ncbi:hypothetical protein Syun_023041 [Stephania yunnanensis]|uniref:C2 domain-containing protein n=1 Tax=Stephania yunnanensis TaxID=152371 RepID=A0AAP0FAM5_9MAGN